MGKIPIFGRTTATIDFFNNLAFVFGIKASHDNILKIPSKTGTGIIRKFDVTPGIDLIFFDFYLKHKIALKKIMAAPTEDKMLSAICILTPAGLVVIKKDYATSDTGEDIPVILFTSIANELDFIIQPDHITKAVIINFKIDSLESEYKGEYDGLYHDLKVFLLQKKYLHFREQASASTYHKLVELHEHATRNYTDKATIRSQTVSLLLDIIRQILLKYRSEEEISKIHYIKMETVKDMLVEYLEAKLPPIPVIAKKMAVSESTLKRNFKQVFGTSIYEYYLQIKMERARELFAEKSPSVKEVAYKLGYEKTSSFIKIFKKFYNFSPGELKRKIITD